MTTFDTVALLREWRARSPEQEAVRAYDTASSRAEGRPILRGTLTVQEAWDQMLALGAAFRQLGVKPGDALALQVPNWPQAYVTYLAAAAVGAVVMPISTIYRGRDLTRQVGIGGATTLIVPAELGRRNYLEDAVGLLESDDLPALARVIAIGDFPATPGVTSWSELVDLGSSPEWKDVRDQISRGDFVAGPDTLSLLNFTSGTTGEPKGVMHTPRTIFSSGDALIERLELTGSDRFFVPATLGHAAGFLNGMFVPLSLGATTVFMDSWDAGTALRIIELDRITYGPAMPTYLLDLADHPEFNSYDISSWSRVRVSGGAIPRQVIVELQDRLPGLRLCAGWGMSEVLYATCGGPHDPPSKLATSDGRALASAEIRIMDRDGRVCPAGETGEIVVRGPSVTQGYFGRENLTRDAMTDDGWFRSGDLGFLDSDGFLTIAGRSKELIIRGGENVPIVEVEYLINSHPRVHQVAIIGLPDRRLGEKVCAVVQMNDVTDRLTLTELRTYLDDAGLTRQFIPEYLEHVDELPRTSLGKLRKLALKRQILAQREQTVVEAVSHPIAD